MAWLVCEPRARRVRAHDARGAGARRRRHPRRRPPPSTPRPATALPVVVIGCGESGLLAGIRLQEAGIPFTIVEKNAGVGGTWWENRYPGARVDVGNHFYCYSFEPADHWTEYFAQQPELQAYFERRAGQARHRPTTSGSATEVARRRPGTTTTRWPVRIRTADGTEETLDGPRRDHRGRPAQPAQPPRHPRPRRLRGPVVPLGPLGPRRRPAPASGVAMVGAGASGFQIAPTIADDVEQLTVFQRTAQWMFPNPNYHAKVGAGRALGDAPPAVLRPLVPVPAVLARLRQRARRRARRPRLARPASARSASVNDVARQMFTDWITSQVGDDPDLLAKVIPDYPPPASARCRTTAAGCGRSRRDNVELVRDGIDHIEADGVVTDDGTPPRGRRHRLRHRLPRQRVLWPMEIVGRGGVDLQRALGRAARPPTSASPCPDFPNLFCMYGPGTNLAHGGSLIFHSECQMRYIGDASSCSSHGGAAHGAAPGALRRVARAHQAEMREAGVVAAVGRAPFYKNAAGEIHRLSPWRLVDYWAWTREAGPGDFVFS